MIGWLPLCIFGIFAVGLVYPFVVTLIIFYSLHHEFELWFVKRMGCFHAQTCTQFTQKLTNTLGIYDIMMNIAANSVISSIKHEKTKQVCFLGDSMFTFWHNLKYTMETFDMVAYNAGFGGSTSKHLVKFAQKLCFDKNPRLILLSIGGNDYDLHKEKCFDNFLENLRILKRRAKKTPIMYIHGPRKPGYSEKKWKLLQDARERIETFMTVIDLEGLDLEYYIDGVHVLPKCNHILGEQIHSIITRV